MSESDSTGQSDTSVVATRPGPGRINGGMSLIRTARSQARTPSASVTIGSTMRDQLIARSRLPAGDGAVLLMAYISGVMAGLVPAIHALLAASCLPSPASGGG